MAVDQFFKIGDVKGETNDDKHKEEIEVLAWSWGMSNNGSTHSATGGGSGKVNVQDLSFTKYVDKASAYLMKACAIGKHYPEATLTVRKAGEKPLEYMVVKLTDVLVTSLSTGGSGGEDRLTENVSLNFAQVNVTYTPQKKDGSGDSPEKFGYNMQQNKAV